MNLSTARRTAGLRTRGLVLTGLTACAVAIVGGCAEPGQDELRQATGASAESENLQQGLAYLASGNYGEAVARFSSVLATEPRNLEALKNRAVAYSRRGQILAGEADLSRAIEIEPKDADLYVQRADLRFAQRRYDAVMDDCRSVISLNKMEDTGAAYSVMCRVHLVLGHFEEAVEACNELLRLHPDTPQALNNRGLAYTNLGQHQKAIEDFTSSLQRNRNQFMPLNNRGIVYLLLGDRERAMADFTKAIEVAPQEPRAYTNRGPLYLKLGDPDHAIADLTRAIGIIRKPGIKPSPQVAAIYCDRGEAYLQKKQLDLSLADCKEALLVNPQSLRGRLLMQQIKKAQGDRVEPRQESSPAGS